MKPHQYLPTDVLTVEFNCKHLSFAQRGAYEALRHLQWLTPGCSIPADDDWIMRKMAVTDKTYETYVIPVLHEFFIQNGDGRLHDPAVTERFEWVTESRSRGRGAAKARWDNEKDPCKRNARDAMQRKEKKGKEKEEERLDARARRAASKKGTRLPSDWTLPSEWRDWALSEGRDLDIDDQALRFRDYWVAKPGAAATKLDWLATWRNWIRNARGGKGNGKGLDGTFAKLEREASAREREASAEILPIEAGGGPGDLREDDRVHLHGIFRGDSHGSD